MPSLWLRASISSLERRGYGRPTWEGQMGTAMEARKNVLVVEDDVALSELVGGLLDEAGYRPVTIADHALIGVAVERWNPRCVILDGEVPATGQTRSWDDAVAIRRAHPELPVLMFSADGAALAEARAGTSERSRAASFAGIVGKPFVVEEFLATVKSAVERAVPSDRDADTHAEADEKISVFPDIGQQLVTDWPATDLFATVVHELRAPLTVMRGQTQLARRFIGQDLARERGALDSALAQMDRIARLIAELLNQSRLSSNALSLKVVAFDLVDAVAAAIARHEYGESAHQLRAAARRRGRAR